MIKPESRERCASVPWFSGAMFGDNLSMISDTTIAATRTQGCEMKDKFRENFKIVLPAAVISLVLFLILANGGDYTFTGDRSIIFLKSFLTWWF